MSTTPPSGKTRLNALDAFRGFAIASMLIVNNPGNWDAIYPVLDHAEWNGWTFTDWIFPFFLFIGGMSMSLSLAGRSGLDKRAILLQCWRRAATIFLIGLALNFIPKLDIHSVRVLGVLQRIGIITALAAPLVLYLNIRQQIMAALALLLVYSGFMQYGQICDLPGECFQSELLPGRDYGAYLDRQLLLGHLWVKSRTWDPEGLLSTLPALVTQLIGGWAGTRLRGQQSVAAQCCSYFIGGLLLLLVGAVLDTVHMPINKSLWTPAYALAMAGWACLLFAAFYWLLDGQPDSPLKQRLNHYARPLNILGMNALFIFALSGFCAKMLGWIKLGVAGKPQSLHTLLYTPLTQLGLAPRNASLLHAVLFTLLMFAIAWLLWRKRIFFKI